MMNKSTHNRLTKQPRFQYFENCHPRTDLHNFQVGVGNTVDVNVIATYQESPQEMFDCVVRVQPINSSVDDQISLEISILEQIIPQLGFDVSSLWKLSICLLLPDFGDSKKQQDTGYGFLARTNGKYFFFADQLDEVSTHFAKKYGAGEAL